MAFVMIAGPRILSASFLATSEDWRRNSAAYVAGAALSITAIVTIAYTLMPPLQKPSPIPLGVALLPLAA